MRKKMAKKSSYTRPIICKTIKVRFCDHANPLIDRMTKALLEIELQHETMTLHPKASIKSGITDMATPLNKSNNSF